MFTYFSLFFFAVNEKRHLPKLDDPVHRLKEIAKDGIYCKRLEKEKILTVQDFLKALNKDPENLAKVNLLNIYCMHVPPLVNL